MKRLLWWILFPAWFCAACSAQSSSFLPLVIDDVTVINVALLLQRFTIGDTSETVKYHPVTREAVEARLKKYKGNNQQREATLKQMFAESGCDDQHVSEQPVKGSKLPNVICFLPGSSDKVIIVGAHFDRVSEGDGVVDNWSGAALLPSLYEAVKVAPRKHTYIFIGFTDEERGEVGSRFYAQQMTKEQIAATGNGEHGHSRSGPY
jgi:putative aminopeptidase FrvX